jgi:cytochrome P450
MLFAISSANRDPAAFQDPNVFKTDRPPKPILATFGPGPRMCPGQHLARKELALVLDVVLERIPTGRSHHTWTAYAAGGDGIASAS